jgi:hypothetical protein
MTDSGYAGACRTARHAEFQAELEALTRAIGDLQARMRLDRWILRQPVPAVPSRHG